MLKRKIIIIDENKCNGCGLCLPNCPEGAIQIIDGKARLVSDLFCDGLGACLGHCPQKAISIEEREACAYDEAKVMANIVKQGPNVIRAHLKHLKDHHELAYLKQAEEFLVEHKIKIVVQAPCGDGHSHGSCPGSKPVDLRKPAVARQAGMAMHQESELGQWPVQLCLLPVEAPYFENADLLIAADCVPFAYASFHQDLLKGKILIVGCPKLDDLSLYQEKLNQVFQKNNIKSVTYAHMEVPCCSGFIPVIKEAIKLSGKDIPFEDIAVTIKGDKL